MPGRQRAIAGPIPMCPAGLADPVAGQGYSCRASTSTGTYAAKQPISHISAFLDQLVICRELGYNSARTEPITPRYESLPGWARATQVASSFLDFAGHRG
jgi:hypothetical protein